MMQKNNEKLSIVHVVPDISKSAYGVGTVVKNLMPFQKKFGYQINLSTLDKPYPDLKNKPPDILHQHMLWLRHGKSAFKLKKKCGAPLIIAPHGALDPWALKKSRLKKLFAWHIYENKRLNFADCLHATSIFEINYFRKLNLKQPIAHIPNGLNLKYFNVPSLNAKINFYQKYPELKHKRCILFLSRIAPQKGLDIFLEAFAAFVSQKEMQNWHFIIVGNDDFGLLKNKLIYQISELGIQEKITILSPKYGDEKKELFAISEVFTLPSLGEGFPMVTLEALASGLPVLTTTASPWMSLPEKYAGWWVRPKVDEILESLNTIGQKDSSELQLMGLNAREIVKKDFSIEEITRKIDLMYRWLLGTKVQPDFIHK